MYVYYMFVIVTFHIMLCLFSDVIANVKLVDTGNSC